MKIGGVRVLTNPQKSWKEIVLSQQRSGLSIAAWCKENNISDSKFYYWRDRLFPKTVSRQSFIEVKENKPSVRQSGVSIECEDLLIHMETPGDLC